MANAWYCLACGIENSPQMDACRQCGHARSASPLEHRRGAAYVLNELETLRDAGTVPLGLYARLRGRYLQLLGHLEEDEAAARSAARRQRAPRAVQHDEGPGWLAEQQANLLLYLGAFLVVIAALIFVGYSEQAISDALRMALLVAGTLVFMVTGLLCTRIPRVRQAGVVFFAVGALMVPLNFVGAYGFFFADEDIDPTGLWLAGSLTSALFYAAVALLGMGRWYAGAMVLASYSGLGAALVLSDAPLEAAPGAFVALAFVLSMLSLVPAMRIREAFGAAGFWTAQAVVPLSLFAALSLTPAVDVDGEPLFELATRWYLPPTVALGALFYWLHAWRSDRLEDRLTPPLTILALSISAATAVTFVFALDVGEQWYGPAVLIVGASYAAGRVPSAPSWFGQRYLGWIGLGAITASWLLFERFYADAHGQGAAVHLGAAALYLAAARLTNMRIPVLSDTEDREDASPFDLSYVSAAAVLIYAAGLAGGIGFFHLLSSLPAAESAEASDLALPFFGLSLGIAAAAATMRLWWRDVRAHVYPVAAGMSMFVLVAAAGAEGQVTVLLAVYTGVSLTLAIWEREPRTLAVPAVMGVFALLATWRHFDPNDAYLPLVISAVGLGLFAVQPALNERDWRSAFVALAFSYAAIAPVIGWTRLAIATDEGGLVGTQEFHETLAYQTAAGTVAALALLAAAHGWLARRIEFAAGASALLMVALLLEIGHFRPENAQAYTAPLGVYLLVASSAALRLRGVPAAVRSLIEPAQALGATVLMGPSLVQAWQPGGWPFALILLAEGLALLSAAIVQRWLWLVGTASGFVVLDALRYLLDGALALPSWATLATAGLLVMAAGTAILLGREQWSSWQRWAQAWWNREPWPGGGLQPWNRLMIPTTN